MSTARGPLLAAVGLLSLLAWGCSTGSAAGNRSLPTPVPLTITPTPSPSPTEVATTPTETLVPTAAPRPGREFAQVLRVWDGNTVLIGGGLSIRYIGVDTPGAGMFNRPLEAFGRQAAERNVGLVEGRRVEIESDATDVDLAGFLLRYVYVDGVMVNETLLREGLGRLAPVGVNTRHREDLERAEAAARAVPLNVWTLITPTPTATVTPAASITPTATVTQAPGGTVRPVTPTPTPGFGLTPVRI